MAFLRAFLIAVDCFLCFETFRPFFSTFHMDEPDIGVPLNRAIIDHLLEQLLALPLNVSFIRLKRVFAVLGIAFLFP